MTIYLAVLAVGLSYESFFHRLAEFHYRVSIPGGSVMEVVATPHINRTVELAAKGKNFRYGAIIPLAKFCEMKPEPIIRAQDPLPMYIVWTLIAVIALSLYMPLIIESRRSRKLRRILPR
jgi:hypothetical protein